MSSFFLAVTASLLLTIGAEAGNWYVRPSSSGANSGTDWNNAWSMSTLNASWASIQPGDTIWLAGGTYRTGMNPKKSGGAGNLIYVKRVLSTDSVPVSAAGWDGSFDSQVVIAPTAAIPLYWNTKISGSYLSFDGRVDSGISLRIDVNASGDPYPGAVTFVRTSSGGQHDITFANIDMAGPAPDSSPYNYNGIYKCALSLDSSWAASDTISNIMVSHCRLHGVADVVLSVNTAFLTIEYSKIYDNCVAGDPATQPHANIFEYNSSHDFTLRYCELYSWQVEGFRPYGRCSNIYIYGNLWHDTVNSVGRVIETDSSAAPSWGPLYFYNNTIVNVQMTTFSATAGVTFAPGTQARNNIFWNASPGAMPPDSDYSFAGGSVAGANSILSGSNPFVNYAGKDYHIVSTIGAKYPRDKGVALDSAYSKDMDGKTRGSDGMWDVGAYEYSTGVAGTNAVIVVTPTSQDFGTVLVGATNNLTFSVKNAGGGTLTGTASVPAPFSIVSGGTFSLAANQSQNVTVRFSPVTVGPASAVITFTGGGGTTVAVTAIGTIPGPTVSVITQNSTDVDPNRTGLQIFAGSVVQYSCSASDPGGLPLTWQWIYTVNGGPEVVLQNGAGTVTSVSFNYVAGTAGSTYVWKLRVSNGVVTTESALLTVGVESSPPPPGTLTFAAGSGVLTAPFATTSGYVSQSVETSVTNGGQAVYGFTTTNSGNYAIKVLVNAANGGANSFYLNIDAQPQDPEMICDLPLTAGFEQRIVSWRGNGTFDNNEFIPKVFTLAPGTHQLVVVGREANVQLQSLSILQLPSTVKNVHTVSP